MTHLFVADEEYALISVGQWDQLDTADLNRARELWDSWRAASWPETSPLPAGPEPTTVAPVTDVLADLVAADPGMAQRPSRRARL